MTKSLNLGNKNYALQSLREIKERKVNDYDVRITNSHITDLNAVIGKKIFKKDALYVGSETLYEIMEPLEKEGKHHHTHGLSPEDIFNALSSIKNSNDVSVSYDNRYVIVTLAIVSDGANLVVIVDPDCPITNGSKTKIIKIITIYPKNKK